MRRFILTAHRIDVPLASSFVDDVSVWIVTVYVEPPPPDICESIMTFFISVLGMLISPVFLIPHQSYRVRFKAVCPPRIFSTEKVPPPNKANDSAKITHLAQQLKRFNAVSVFANIKLGLSRDKASHRLLRTLGKSSYSCYHTKERHNAH